MVLIASRYSMSQCVQLFMVIMQYTINLVFTLHKTMYVFGNLISAFHISFGTISYQVQMWPPTHMLWSGSLFQNAVNRPRGYVICIVVTIDIKWYKQKIVWEKKTSYLWSFEMFGHILVARSNYNLVM